MKKSSGYANILTRINDRAADAILSKGRINSKSLSAALSQRLHGSAGRPDAFVGDPFFEAARIWQRADCSLDDLAGGMLEEDLVAALDGAPTRSWPRRGDDVAPYLHQLRAWEAAEAERSFMVTSGTGSGKTECFMIPMLNDLLRQSQGRRKQGVQAIVLYPLNALIDSQKERLSEWIDPLSDRLTYALYNRHLDESLPARQQRHGAEIRDRKTLRTDPASVLVTNVTMLEYMLMRAQDRTILEKSQGTLRWIVLDEAHSYVGAQAAEMALLLRRVRDAFGVSAEDVRLAATSATIGEGEETKEDLRQFLADLAGLRPDQVEVIEGEELEPSLPQPADDIFVDPTALKDDVSALWETLACNPRIQRIRAKMRDGGITLGDASRLLGNDTPNPDTAEQSLRVLEAAAMARDPETGILLAPWRLHVFHRAQGGLWACVDPECKERHAALCGCDADWPFGQVWFDQRDHCKCGAPVFEVGACDECGKPWLLANVLREGPHEYLRQTSPNAQDDEYILDAEPDDITDEEVSLGQGVAQTVLIGTASENTRDFLRVSDSALFEHPDAKDRIIPVSIIGEASDRGCCARSGRKGVIVRPQRYGAPFLMGNALPLLLEAAKPNPRDYPVPFGGRRMLSFTDSRQGTARFSAKLQQEAERNLTRAVIYHTVQKRDGDSAKADQLRASIEALRPLVVQTPALASTLQDQEAALLEAEGGRKPVSWGKMIEALAGNPELHNFARPVWRDRPEKGENALAEDHNALAELFLYRELFRRPRLQNNVETMGIARLVFTQLDEQAKLSIPEALKEAGHDSKVWSDVLHAAIDLVFRSNLAIALPQEPADVRHWISPRSALSVVLEPGLPPDTETTVKQPRPFPTQLSRSGLTSMLYRLTGGSMESAVDADRVADVLTAIWTALRKAQVIKSVGPSAWRLDLSKASIMRLDEAFECPVTRRLLPYAPAGRSMNAMADERVTRPIQMPALPLATPNGPGANERETLREWIKSDPLIADLRLTTHWSNIHDRIAEFTPFLRAQEHSAQIDRSSLKTYEDAFRRGEINVLNCSTTMEMGVDIPDVGIVVNTNVPPAPTNYRQRIGRAGRRGEPWAMAFTFCKDLPLDRMIFRDPSRLLRAQVQAPQVRLDSAVLVQRHVNALLLGLHLRGAGGMQIKTSIGTFFGATEDVDSPFMPENVAEVFLMSLKGDWAVSQAVTDALTMLVRGTCLQGNDGLIARCEQAFEAMWRHWQSEYHQLLKAQSAYPETEAAHRLYKYRAKRMRDEFMMSDLARRGFTPSYGFPVDVVSFDHVGSGSAESGPSRQLELAIREYSPGCEVVINGLVHRSEGILPTWGNRNDPSSVEDLRTLYTCRACGAFGTTRQEISACPRCDEPVRRQELLRPSGFLGTGKPHSAYEKLAYVAPDLARVSADPEDWHSMVDAGVGRHRTARAGRVLTTASGEYGLGYAICIACGRAASEENQDNPNVPSGMKNHRPLQRLRDNPRDDGLCPGNDEGTRKIRRGVRLGTEVTTDVFELQLEALPPTESGKAQAWAIAAGMREALAMRLGVDAETIGLSVAPSLRADRARRFSVFLFDKASGGSGFASAAARDIDGLLARAAERLDCTSDCASGCPECILRRDMQFGSEGLDRRGALETLQHSILPRLALPEDQQVFGDQTQAVTSSLLDWCARQATQGEIDRLTLYLADAPFDWDIPIWPGTKALTLARNAGAKVSLAMRWTDMKALDMSQKLDLFRLVARTEASLHALDEIPSQKGLSHLAEIQIKGHDFTVVSGSSKAIHIDAMWGSVAEGPLLLGPKPQTKLSASLSPEKLTAFGEGNSAQRGIKTELDGSVSQFGTNFWKIVSALRPQAFAAGRQLASVTYSDRYLRSPLTARLLLEAVRKVPLMSETTSVEIISETTGQIGRPGYQLHHNWETDALRKDALMALLPKAKVRLVPKADCAHARYFRLNFDDGSSITVFLDQGLGAWRTASSRPIRFDLSASAQSQAKELLGLSFDIAIQEGGTISSPIWVSW
jgi:DEAD/DEAH box helicase domain-containing protein